MSYFMETHLEKKAQICGSINCEMESNNIFK